MSNVEPSPALTSTALATVLDLVPAAVALTGAEDGVVAYANEPLRTLLDGGGEMAGRQRDHVLDAR